MKRRRVLFAIVIALQMTFLLGWAGYHEWLRHMGPVVRLRVRPVDPRDFLRGQYFVLSYDISQASAPAEVGRLDSGRVVWVGLEPGEDFWRTAPNAIYLHRAEARAAHAVAVRAIVQSRTGDLLRLRYGIESYFVPEGTPTVEQSRLVVEAGVAPDGTLNIRRVLLDGGEFP